MVMVLPVVLSAQPPALSGQAREAVTSRLAELRRIHTVPVVVIQGKHDLHTPYESAKAFVERVKAPSVRFITLEHSGHVPMLEEQGRFLLALIQDVLPLTGQGR